MSEKISEQVSALVDDELDQAEQDLLVRRLLTDEAMREQLARYQLASDVLHSELPGQVDPAFHRRVSNALLDADAPAVVTTGKQARGLLRPVAGLAIAASVAVVAVVSLQNDRTEQPGSGPVVATAPPDPQDYIRAEGLPAPVAPNRNLDAYLVNHNEYAVNRGMRGMLPYVRIVGQGQAPGSDEDTQ